jgi:hypothetical protein
VAVKYNTSGRLPDDENDSENEEDAKEALEVPQQFVDEAALIDVQSHASTSINRQHNNNGKVGALTNETSLLDLN